MKNNYKKTLALIATTTALVIGGSGVSSALNTVPEELQLKASFEKVVWSNFDETSVGTTTVQYLYETNEDITPVFNEVISKRTEQTVTQSFGNNSYAVTSYLGTIQVKDTDGVWKKVKSATTTKDAFNKQKPKKVGFVNLAFALDTGYKDPSATGEDYNDWADPTNAYIDNSQYSLPSSALDEQDYYNFTFGIPTSAIVDGIEASVNWGANEFSGTGAFVGLELSHNGGTNYTSSGFEVDMYQYVAEETDVVGSSTEKWGRSWSGGEFSNTNFRIKMKADGGDQPAVDHLKVRVYYTEFVKNGKVTNDAGTIVIDGGNFIISN